MIETLTNSLIANNVMLAAIVVTVAVNTVYLFMLLKYLKKCKAHLSDILLINISAYKLVSDSANKQHCHCDKQQNNKKYSRKPKDVEFNKETVEPDKEEVK